MIIKTATAYSRKFLMVLASDHISGATGKTVTVKISKGPGAAGTTPGGVVTELDSTNCPGVYQIALTSVDTGISGDLWYTCSASGCDNTDFCDQVQSQVFTDLVLNANGRIGIWNNLQQNVALNPFLFPMTSTTTGTRQTGLTVTAQRTLGAGGFAACANAVSEISGTGIYSINLAATDLNAATVGLLFTASGANDLFVPVTPTP